MERPMGKTQQTQQTQQAKTVAGSQPGPRPIIDPAISASLAIALAAMPDLSARMALISRTLGAGVRFSTSLGLEDQVILHAIAEAAKNGAAAISVFTLDTGRHFPETLDTLEASEQRYGLKIQVLAPEASAVEALVSRDGINGFRASVEARKACCDVRKVQPLKRGLAGARGWVTGLRRGQSQGRSDVPFAELDQMSGLIKVNPLADWSLEQTEAYAAKHAIPLNPLHQRGFPSIGCQPCTRAILPGEDIRAGRWWWEAQDGKECGLHNSPARAKTAQASRVPGAAS
jgi:phosphoadenosine phosphosulfate reductase